MSGSIDELARKHGVSVDAVRVLQNALRRGGGQQAQFSHPDLGGMGQWSAGGMTQVGDMFNTALEDKVNALCGELAKSAATMPPMNDPPAMQRQGDKPQGEEHHGETRSGAHGNWWPQDLGRPSATGSQNGMRYACFPDARRVAVEQAGRVTLYDSGEHRINGVSQSQSGGQELSFSSQHGTIRASELPVAH
jgi:hypothetical protein